MSRTVVEVLNLVVARICHCLKVEDSDKEIVGVVAYSACRILAVRAEDDTALHHDEAGRSVVAVFSEFNV